MKITYQKNHIFIVLYRISDLYLSNKLECQPNVGNDFTQKQIF